MLKCRQDLDALRQTARSAYNAQAEKIIVCAGTGCVAGGSLKVFDRLKELLVCYLAESREGQTLDLHYDLGDPDCVQVDAYRREGEENHRVFSARMLYA